MTRSLVGVPEILLGYSEGNTTFQGSEVMHVPPETYTDPAQWNAEIELIFKKVPLMLALTCELPNPGDYKATYVVGLPVMLIRDRAGLTRAFLNVCGHRWAPLKPEGLGHCGNFRLSCPFHGWTYGVDGKLIAVAESGRFGAIDRATRGLKELPCEEKYGMIFVCLTPGSRLDLHGYYGDLLEEYAAFGLQHWAVLGTRTKQGANWKMILNNFFESYHFATLHANTVAVEFASNQTHYQGFGPNMRLSLSRKVIGKLRLMPPEQWPDREGREYGFIRFFFPNVSGAIWAREDHSLFTLTYPGATPDTSRTDLLFIRRDPPKDDAEKEAIKTLIDSTVAIDEEDFGVGIEIQRALRSGAHDGLLFGCNERGNQYFQQWRNWFLKGDPSAVKPTM